MLYEYATFSVARPVTTRGLVYDLCGALPFIDDPDVLTQIAKLVSRELRKLRTSPTRFVEIALASGQTLDVDLHDDFGAKLAHGYFQEASDWNVVSRLVNPGMTVIDVGANVGIYSVELARRVGPDGRVLAFEPIPEIAAILRGNIDKNGYDNVVVRREAASQAEGTANYYVAESASLSGLFPTVRNNVHAVTEVRMLPLDAVSELQGRPVDFIKIDAEGAEADVLAGAHEVITRSPELVIMLEYSTKNLEDVRLLGLVSALQNLAAQGFRIYPGNAATTSIDVLTSHALRPGSTGNLFLCRADSAGEARYLQAAADVGAIVPSAAEMKKRFTLTIAACLRLVRTTDLAILADGLKHIDVSVSAAVGRLGAVDDRVVGLERGVDELVLQVRDLHASQTRLSEIADRVVNIGGGVDELVLQVRDLHASQTRLAEIVEASSKRGLFGLLRRLTGRA